MDLVLGPHFFADCLHFNNVVFDPSEMRIFFVVFLCARAVFVFNFYKRKCLGLCFVFGRRDWIAGVETSWSKGQWQRFVWSSNPISLVQATCASVVRNGDCGKERVLSVMDFPFCCVTRQRTSAGFSDGDTKKNCNCI